MGIVNAVEEKIKTWLFTVALKKGFKRIVQLVIAWLLAHSPAKFGIDIQVDPVVLEGAIFGGLEVLRNWLKIRFPKACGWI